MNPVKSFYSSASSRPAPEMSENFLQSSCGLTQFFMWFKGIIVKQISWVESEKLEEVDKGETRFMTFNGKSIFHRVKDENFLSFQTAKLTFPSIFVAGDVWWGKSDALHKPNNPHYGFSCCLKSTLASHKRKYTFLNASRERKIFLWNGQNLGKMVLSITCERHSYARFFFSLHWNFVDWKAQKSFKSRVIGWNGNDWFDARKGSENSFEKIWVIAWWDWTLKSVAFVGGRRGRFYFKEIWR